MKTEEPTTIKCGKVIAQHNPIRWRTCTNRHPTRSGYSWGWIEGAPGNVCWSNDSSFGEKEAAAVCAEHNAWFERLTPIDVRIMKAKNALEQGHKDSIAQIKTIDARMVILRAELHKLEAERDSSL